jgi:hypothetical protein
MKLFQNFSFWNSFLEFIFFRRTRMKKKTAIGLTVLLLLYVLLGIGCSGVGQTPPSLTDPALVGKIITVTADDGSTWTLVFTDDEVLVNGMPYQYTADGSIIVISDLGEIPYTVTENGSFSSTDFLGKGAVPEVPLEADPTHVPETPEEISETVQELIDQGTEALLAGTYDIAIAAFEKAYIKDASNPKAVIYSSLGRLASIAKDKDIRALLQNHLGVQNYPGTIDALISLDWLQDYPEEQFVWNYYDELTNRWISWYGEAVYSTGWGSSVGANMPSEISEPGYYYWDDYENVNVGTALKYYTGNEYERKDQITITIGEDENSTGYWQTGNEGTGYYYYDYYDANWNRVLYSSEPQYYAAGDPMYSYYEGDRYIYWDWVDGIEGYYYTRAVYTLVSKTPKYETYTTKLPQIPAPGWFKETDAYKNSLTASTATPVESAATLSMNIFASVLDKNTNGLNDLLDGALASVFGSAFEEAAARIETLKYEDSVELEAKVSQEFGLNELLEGEKIYIGRAEMDLLIAALRVVKASLEWLTSYDWNTDLSFLKTGWDSEKGLIETLKKMDPGKLPLNNNFLKIRSAAAMDRAKEDYLKAITAILGAYDHIGEKGPQIVKDTVKEFAWIKTGLGSLKTAIESGAVFYVPQDDPTASGVWNATAANALLGLDMKLFFTPGAFSLDKLIKTEGGKPVFYGEDFDNNNAVGTISKAEDLAAYEIIGIGLILKPLDDLVSPGLDLSDEVEYLYFPKEIGELLYKKYYGLPL